MKRLAPLCAVALMLSASAHAQSSVTIYGRLNLTVENEKTSGKSAVWNLDNNSSRIGFKGTEDLGGGLKAGFQLEHGFSPDTGAASAVFWGRRSELFLGGTPGTLRLGNMVSEAYYATADYVSMHNHDTGNSADVFYAYVGRNANKLAYASPQLSGATYHASVSLAEGGGGKRNYDFAANWVGGPLHLGAGYGRGDGEAWQFAARALYEMGPLAVGGYLQRDHDGLAAGLGNRTTLRLAAMYAVGEGELHANLGRAGDYSNLSDSKANQYTVGYNHHLSKRTKVYAYWTAVDDSALVYHKGADFRSLAMGVRHNF
jgi:predicted porin